MKPSDISGKKVIISVLNWGFGHVARSIGLIEELRAKGNEIIVAGDKDQIDVFKQYFPDITYVKHEGYPFKFGGKGNFSWDLFKVLPKLNTRLKTEFIEVEKYVKEYQPDLILSDHRYGFRSDSIHSIFITHQLHLPVRWFERGMQWWHKRLVDRFDEIWVMDYSDSRLAGKLSVSKGYSNVEYIGPYSRFMHNTAHPERDIEGLLIASGPNIYAQQLIDQNVKDGMTVICAESLNVPEGVRRCSSDWKEQDQLILRAKEIISRSGYSTIMDAEFLKAEIVKIPTPGQREQEYLSSRKYD